MPNIQSVLREEISRLARKELKANTDTLRKTNSQQRRDIAELKRQVSELTRTVKHLERAERKRIGSAVPETAAEGRRFSQKGLIAHRKKLGLSAADYAELVGVTGQTIYSWEQGKSRPRDSQLAALVAVRALGKREAERRLEMIHG